MEQQISSTNSYFPCNGNLKSHKWFCTVCWKDTRDIVNHMSKSEHLEKLRLAKYLDVITGSVNITCPLCLIMIKRK